MILTLHTRFPVQCSVSRYQWLRPATAATCALMLLVGADAVPAQTCPLSPVATATLPAVLAPAAVSRRTQPDAVVFTSKADRDDDGAPTAYHRGLQDDRPDPGLDHICVGGSVLELADGRLRDRYGKGGSIGQLGGVDPKTGVGRSQLCKRDYIALRDAGFPACGPGQLCMIWYGIAAQKRACGHASGFGGADDPRCGTPIRQLDAQGQPTDYYLTTTALRRQGAPGDTRNQADYVDAAQVPYVVMPGGVKLPVATPWATGDLAVLVWKGRTVYAVVGDTGPAGKLGEVSRAALKGLRNGGIAALPPEDPVTTLVFPGTAGQLQGRWPLTAAAIAVEGRKLVQAAGGAAALARCPGLTGLQ